MKKNPALLIGIVTVLVIGIVVTTRTMTMSPTGQVMNMQVGKTPCDGGWENESCSSSSTSSSTSSLGGGTSSNSSQTSTSSSTSSSGGGTSSNSSQTSTSTPSSSASSSSSEDPCDALTNEMADLLDTAGTCKDGAVDNLECRLCKIRAQADSENAAEDTECAATDTDEILEFQMTVLDDLFGDDCDDLPGSSAN